MRRHERINISVSAEEKALIALVSGEKGMLPATWLRWIALEKLKALGHTTQNKGVGRK